MIRRLNIVAVVLIQLLTMHGIIVAQEEETHENSLREGSVALLFQVGTNFTLRPFQSGALAAKYHTSSSEAIRLTVGASGFVNDGTSASTPSAPDTTIVSRSVNNSANAINLQTSIQYFWYLPSVEPIHVFVGVGPQGQYRRDHSEATESTGLQNTWTSMTLTRTTKSWSAGAAGALGLEWFFTRSFSLHAEYGSVLQYTWSSSTEEIKVISNSPSNVSPAVSSSGKAKGWSFTSDSFRFGLTAYF